MQLDFTCGFQEFESTSWSRSNAQTSRTNIDNSKKADTYEEKTNKKKLVSHVYSTIFVPLKIFRTLPSLISYEEEKEA